MLRLTAKIHRWLGLAAALLWLIQALTGLLLTFHWELEGMGRTDVYHPTDLAAIERRMDALAPKGSAGKVNWIWTTAGLPDQYAISIVDAGGSDRMVRIDGVGNVLSNVAEDEQGLFHFALEIHEGLMAGETGSWIVGISGVLLLSNLIVGVIIAWPKRGRWREPFMPITRGGTTARLYSWHRAVGLWAAIPAAVLVGTGTLMVFEDGFRAAIGAPEAAFPAVPARSSQIGFAKAAQAAVTAIPGSKFVGTALPGREDASYYISVRTSGELYRAYAGSLVVVDGNNGAVRGRYPWAEADLPHTIAGALYPVHTGESAGLIGRILVLSLGVWLVVMIVAGVWLWLRRRPKKRARGAVEPGAIDAA